MSVIGRRELIAALGGAAAAWPLAARAQQSSMPVIGFLNSETPAGYAPMAAAFRQGLNEAGFVEGKNVAIEYRWAHSQNERLPALAAELVRHPVVLIAAAGAAPALAAKAATTTIPIVFSTGADPVQAGLVASLHRPGSNVTGVANLGVELLGKQLEMLHEMVPSATTVAGLVNPNFPASEVQAKDLQAAAIKLGLQLHVLHASADRDFDTVFETIARLRVAALVIAVDAFFISRKDRIIALALRHAVPSIYYLREFAASGGLMSYGTSVTDGYRRVGIYAGRILKGEKPADLPVQQSTKFELIINLNTAKAFGLTVPFHLQQLADEVIE
jgi:putative ABC transport system substrate-binding protein